MIIILLSDGKVTIKVNDGNVRNFGVAKTLIKTTSLADLNIDVTNGAIGEEVGPCAGGICTGIGTDARDLTKSVNTSIDGNITALSSGTGSLINLASLNKNMNVNQIKADGRVILLADDSANKGKTAYDILNKGTDGVPNVEGAGISIIASGSIGENGKALTFRQNGAGTIFYGDDATQPHVITPVNKPEYGVDMLAINDINVKGIDAEDGTKLDTNICAMISRTGSINAEFSGDTYIGETTAQKSINITTRGKIYIFDHLGEVPSYCN